MKTQEEFINVEGGSVLIIRIVESNNEHADNLLAEPLRRYAYVAKPYGAIVVDISLGGYFISDLDLVSMVMSLPAGSSERTACAVVTRKRDALQLQKFLDVTKMASLVRSLPPLTKRYILSESGWQAAHPVCPLSSFNPLAERIVHQQEPSRSQRRFQF